MMRIKILSSSESVIPTNHNYNKILESDWFLARPIFYQIGARAAKESNNKVSNNKVYYMTSSVRGQDEANLVL